MTSSQAPTKRSGDNKGRKGKQKVGSKKAKTNMRDSGTDSEADSDADSGWPGIAPLRKLHSIAAVLKKSNIHYQS